LVTSAELLLGADRAVLLHPTAPFQTLVQNACINELDGTWTP
jgi:hypothetical protein